MGVGLRVMRPALLFFQPGLGQSSAEVTRTDCYSKQLLFLFTKHKPVESS